MEYMTATQLGIKPKLRNALIWVLKNLESGRFTYNKEYFDNRDIPMGFNMGTVIAPNVSEHLVLDQTEYYCSTTACICGWAAIKMEGIKPEKMGYVMNKRVLDLADSMIEEANDSLDQLFLGYWVGRDGNEVELKLESLTDKQSARALRNYLTVGKPKWSRIATKMNKYTED
jgi:hypothetical protein